MVAGDAFYMETFGGGLEFLALTAAWYRRHSEPLTSSTFHMSIKSPLEMFHLFMNLSYTPNRQ